MGGEFIIENKDYTANAKNIGLIQIVNDLAKGVNIQLNQEVTKIDYSNKNIILVESRNASSKKVTQVSCKYVIITVPLGVLKAR